MVQIQNKTPSPLPIQSGEGDVFNVPLFLIAINNITKNVNFPITQRTTFIFVPPTLTELTVFSKKS